MRRHNECLLLQEGIVTGLAILFSPSSQKLIDYALHFAGAANKSIELNSPKLCLAQILWKK